MQQCLLLNGLSHYTLGLVPKLHKGILCNITIRYHLWEAQYINGIECLHFAWQKLVRM